MRKLTWGGVVFLFYVVTSAYFTWPLLERLGSGLSDSPDSLLNYWALSWSFHVLPRAPFELFQANIFFPRPDTLAYSEHLFGVTLLAWPVFFLSGNAVLAQNVVLFSTFVLSGLGMYLLAYDMTQSRWSALLAGVIYAFAPFRFLHLLHIQLLSSQWFPFVFLYLNRFLREGRARHIVAAGAFALLQLLSCNYYALYLALALAIFAAALLIAERSLLDARRVTLGAVTFSVVALTALPFFLPYERNRREQGFYRRYEDVLHFSAAPLDYLRPSALNKSFYRDVLPPLERSEKALFPGFLALGLAATGLSVGRGTHRFLWLFLAALVAAAWVLSLGPTTPLPYRFFYKYVPGFSGLRAPARLALLVLFGVAALAGTGWAWTLERSGRFRHALGSLAIGIALFEYRTDSLARILPAVPESPPVYRWLASQPGDFGILELPMEVEITRESVRMLHSTTHWKRLANGFSGWWPNDYWELVGRTRSFPNARVLRFLEAHVPVRFLVIHYAEYPGKGAVLREAMDRYRDRLPLRARFGEDAVHEILP